MPNDSADEPKAQGPDSPAEAPKASGAKVRSYASFPDFSLWQGVPIRNEDWERGRSHLVNSKPTDSAKLDAGLAHVRRMAAADTGALEGLYQVDQGFTHSVGLYAASRDLARHDASKDAQARTRMITAQLDAYDLVVSLATRKYPVAEALIRRLHEEVCREQATYSVNTPEGSQELVLPRGKYKEWPNNVTTADGVVFEYCPVPDVNSEMNRLIEALSSEAFQRAHPVIQAAFAHYAFILIHPFADGNGRVARLLASLFLCRAASIPLLIFADQRSDYIRCLRAADEGRFELFVDFVLGCTLSTFRIVTAAIQMALLPDTAAAVGRLRSAYVSRAEIPFEELDAAVSSFMMRLREAVAAGLQNALGDAGAVGFGHHHQLAFSPARQGDRANHGMAGFAYSVTSRPPMQVAVQGDVQCETKRNPGREDVCNIRWKSNAPNRAPVLLLEARVGDVVTPGFPVVGVQLQLGAEQLVRSIISDLAEEAIRVRREGGFM